MNASMTSFNSGGSSSLVKDIVIGLVAVAVLYLALGSFEFLYNYINRLEKNRVTLLPISYQMNARTKQLIQNPNISNDKTITQSMNEATGLEFSYSFFLNVPQQAFNGTATSGLKHIFHKGSPSQFPLLGPGVYMYNNTNTMRIYMNSYDTWNNSVDVTNFPIGKWCHVVIVCRSMHLEVYVNGNIVSRLGFNVSPPYQNYGDLYAFSSRKPTMPTTIASLNGDTNFNITGVCEGMLSKLLYFNYALSYSEINSLMNEGPSSTLDTGGEAGKATNYLADNWWSADFTQ